MPHFVIDCSENVIILESPHFIMQEVHDAAEETGLFKKGDIKVRINPFKDSNVGGVVNKDFIHVFANIMEGRTEDQKRSLSERIVRKLTTMFPEVPVISMNVRDFEKATYCNRKMLE